MSFPVGICYLAFSREYQTQDLAAEECLSLILIVSLFVPITTCKVREIEGFGLPISLSLTLISCVIMVKVI